MTEEPQGNNMRLLVTLAVALLLVVVVIWMLTGGFGRGEGEEETATAYEADVTDESGELIVTDPEAEGVEDLTLPETPMTPVPADEPTAAAPPE